MNRNHVNYALDALLLLIGLAVLATGLMLAWVIPRGSGRRGLELWGLARHDWADVHLWLALAMTAAVVLHLGLHWGWVHTTTARLLGRRARAHGPGARLSMAVALVVLLGLVLGVVFAARGWLAG